MDEEDIDNESTNRIRNSILHRGRKSGRHIGTVWIMDILTAFSPGLLAENYIWIGMEWRGYLFWILFWILR